MCSSLRHRILILLIGLSGSYLTAQAVVTKPYPFYAFLSDLSISDSIAIDSIKYDHIIRGVSMQQFLETPIYYFAMRQYDESYTAFARLLEVFPQALNRPEYQVPIIKSYDLAHKIEDLSPTLWDVVAQNYNNQSFVQVPNMFYTALKNHEEYIKSIDETKTRKMILSANSSKDETKISIDYRLEKIVVSRHDRLEGESFYIAQKNKGKWTPFTKEPFISIIGNTETAASIDASGRYLIYTQCMSRAWESLAGGGCDLWFTTSESDSTWSPSEKYQAGINTPAFEGLAAFSMDGRAMYFTSDREGGYGGRDIWVSRWDGKEWVEPKNAGAEINSAFDDFSPYISEDGSRLFFASNRERRQSDIYVHTLGSDTVAKLPAPINTTKDEISCHVDAKDGIIIVASNAHTANSDFDLEIYKLPTEYISDSTRTITGQMLYLHTLQPYYAEYGRDLGFDTQEDYFKMTNRGNGWYFWDIVGAEPVYKMEVRSLKSFDDKTAVIPVEQKYLSDRLIWNHLYN